MLTSNSSNISPNAYFYPTDQHFPEPRSNEFGAPMNFPTNGTFCLMDPYQIILHLRVMNIHDHTTVWPETRTFDSNA